MQLERDYSVSYSRINELGQNISGSILISKSSFKDLSSEVASDVLNDNLSDPSFKITSVRKHMTGSIDWELNERMSAIRSLCELGHKVRADAKIRNRQPLKKAYAFINNQLIQDHMIYIDCGLMEYANIIANELNVLDVEFLDGSTDKFFDFSLKPNFKMLGPKGLGKQAQKLKTDLAAMSLPDRSKLYKDLKNSDGMNVFGLDLKLEDIEIELIQKPGFASATNKVGAIILDTEIDDRLLSLGFIADLRSELQNIRKEAKLLLTDKIFVELYCDAHEAKNVDDFKNRLCKDILATGIECFPYPSSFDKDMHEMQINNKNLLCKIYKEL